MSVKYREKVSGTSREGRWFHDAITVARSRQEIYNLWQDNQNWQTVMPYVVSATPSDQDGVYDVKAQVYSSSPPDLWLLKVARTPESHGLSWIAYKEDSVISEGRLELVDAPAGRGTEVHLRSYFRFAGGNLTHFLSKLTGRNPDRVMRESLRRLKALIEAGEIPTIYGQPRGAGEKVESRKKPENVQTQAPIIAEL